MRGATLAALLMSAPAGAVEVQPLYSFEFLGGQYFFSGQRGSLTGNAAALAAPAVLLSERLTLLPSLSSRYQGTKQVVDLVGAGSLFSEQMDHRAALKAVYKPAGSKWSLKPAGSYRLQLLKETVDERWFRGLFDYRTLDLGVEAEYAYRDPFSVRLGADLLLTEFPNYSSLESGAGSDLSGASLARELSGGRVLDNRAALFTAAASAPLPGRGAADAELRFAWTVFPEQRVVLATGLLSEDRREDFTTAAAAGARWPVELAPETVLWLSMGAAFSSTLSNQNSFDALRAQFQAGYYDSVEAAALPGLRLLFGDERRPIAAALGARAAWRRYPHRKAQDAAGSYLEEGLRQVYWSLSASLDYPMAPRLSLVASVQLGRAASNQAFEQFYSYNYSATNYLLGFRYEY